MREERERGEREKAGRPSNLKAKLLWGGSLKDFKQVSINFPRGVNVEHREYS